ncbi:MAG: CPBP family intramembrane metalloprotease [Candidatus Rokubacteria bacterium]|nr:CPBP family intramembrane metalloprotease [Candidatus Rokubacteria bacterium]
MDTVTGSSAAAAGGPPVVGSRSARGLTLLSAFVVVAFAALVGGLVSSSSRLDSQSFPEASLALVTGRTMDVRIVVERLPRWERGLMQLLMDDRARELAQAIGWYEELAERVSDPSVELQLAVLEGEAGRLPRLREKLEGWEVRPEPYPAMAVAIASAYLGTADFPTEALGSLPADGHPWFGEQLALRLALRRGDTENATELLAARADRTRPLVARLRALAAIELGALGGGLAAVLIVLVRRRSLRLASAPLPPPWSGALGAEVLVRGAALQIGLLAVLYAVSQLADSEVLDALTWPWSNLFFLPMLLLARRRLVVPAGLRLRDALGLSLDPGVGGRLALTVLLLVGLGLAGDWVSGILAARAGRTSHWTEWFDEDLVWGGGGDAALAVVSAVIAAPFFEEIVFRGLLFATFRRRFGTLAAALASSAIFAVAHGYGVVGLFSVLWSGVLWAWAYERTRSLWPGMLAHALVNLLASLSLLLLLR